MRTNSPAITALLSLCAVLVALMAGCTSMARYPAPPGASLLAFSSIPIPYRIVDDGGVSDIRGTITFRDGDTVALWGWVSTFSGIARDERVKYYLIPHGRETVAVDRASLALPREYEIYKAPTTFRAGSGKAVELWSIAQVWILGHSTLKLQTISDTLLQTEMPKEVQQSGWRITRRFVGDSVEFDVKHILFVEGGTPPVQFAADIDARRGAFYLLNKYTLVPSRGDD